MLELVSEPRSAFTAGSEFLTTGDVCTKFETDGCPLSIASQRLEWGGDTGRKTRAERKTPDPAHHACPLPDSFQVMQRTSRMTELISRMEMPVMNPYTHRGM